MAAISALRPSYTDHTETTTTSLSRLIDCLIDRVKVLHRI